MGFHYLLNKNHLSPSLVLLSGSSACCLASLLPTVIGSRWLALAGFLSRSEYFCIYWVKLSLEAVLRLATKKKKKRGILQIRHFEGEKVTVASEVAQG